MLRFHALVCDCFMSYNLIAVFVVLLYGIDSTVVILLQLVKHSNELAQMIVDENGKNFAEALADVAKGNETVEWACSLPQLAPGRHLEVSRYAIIGHSYSHGY